jgi:hypothetical protein
MPTRRHKKSAGITLKIGDKVMVKFHPSKDWEKAAFEVKAIYLNDVMVRPWRSNYSCRTVHSDLVKPYESEP